VIFFCFCVFWFQIFCNWSGQTLYDSWFIAVFNVFFTSFPVIFASIFNQDVKEKYSIEYPIMYTAGQKSMNFNIPLLILWLLDAIYGSLAIYFCSHFLFLYGIIYPDGKGYGLWDLGNIVYSVVIHTATIRIALETNYWTAINHIFVWGSLIAFYVFSALYSSKALLFLSTNEYYLFFELWSNAIYWFSIILISIIATLPYFIIRYAKSQYFPSAYTIIAERQKLDQKMPKRKLHPFLKRKGTKIIIEDHQTEETHKGYAFDAPEGIDNTNIKEKKKKNITKKL